MVFLRLFQPHGRDVCRPLSDLKSARSNKERCRDHACWVFLSTQLFNRSYAKVGGESAKRRPPSLEVAEREGFEPSVGFSYARFPGVCLKPLSHLSTGRKGPGHVRVIQPRPSQLSSHADKPRASSFRIPRADGVRVKASHEPTSRSSRRRPRRSPRRRRVRKLILNAKFRSSNGDYEGRSQRWSS